MPETVLETQGLTMQFGGVLAVAQVDFRMDARELRCLIGPNGAGKSTFFKCITGLLPPTEGQIFMRGQETTRWPSHHVASLGVGTKTQVPSVMDGLSVFENIWLAARRFLPPRAATRKADETITRLALGPVARSSPGRLAHGERQHVELGMVMAGDPWLVLLDEPAAGMTGGDVERLTEIVEEFARTAAVVVVEHDMQFIRSIARTVTVFHRGAVLLEGHVDAVLADPAVRSVYLGQAA
ncbi:MAG: ATP-binding cassette domain-containing protein [Chloroflexi bacterium]|nr:ATP-binding cassette domain-containing protein [Chloroflexota bacterium]